jgi:TonB family protein
MKHVFGLLCLLMLSWNLNASNTRIIDSLSKIVLQSFRTHNYNLLANLDFTDKTVKGLYTQCHPKDIKETLEQVLANSKKERKAAYEKCYTGIKDLGLNLTEIVYSFGQSNDETVLCEKILSYYVSLGFNCGDRLFVISYKAERVPIGPGYKDKWVVNNFKFLGELKTERIVDEGPDVPPPPVEQPLPDTPFEVYEVEVQPEFPGGMDSLKSFFKRNLQYPKLYAEDQRQGTVYVKFVIDTTGKTMNAVILKGVSGSPLFDKEALRLISIMPNWKPGMMKGKKVKSYYTLPVKFKLQ